MPKHLALGNGNLLIALDKQLMIHDLYFPYVGMEDQTTYNHSHRIGVYIDHRFSWLNNGLEWESEALYEKDTLVGASKTKNKDLELEITFNDGVHYTENIFLRKLLIKNNKNENRKFRVFFYQDIHLYGDKLQDTALYEPVTNSVIHYRKRRYFLINGLRSDGKGISTYTVGKSEYQGYEGSFRDAEDGSLQRNTIVHGSVDSTLGFDLEVTANGETILYYWICAGKKMSEINHLNLFVQREKPEKLLNSTRNYWKSWATKHEKFTDKKILSGSIEQAFNQSLLIIRSQTDNRGAILAANDNDIMRFNKDTYTYMWPRDGAFIAMTLDKCGYIDITRRFYEFCADVITDSGFFLHKYNPDKSLGSSWHPWYKNEKKQLPIQEDETALVLAGLAKHYEVYKDLESIQMWFNTVIKPAANFIHDFVYPKSHLPFPSYDMWEEYMGIHTFTCASVYAGLTGAAYLSKAMGDSYHYNKYKKRAEEIKEAILQYLWDEKNQRFLKFIEVDSNEEVKFRDERMDAGIMFLYFFGVLDKNDKRLQSSMDQLKDALRVKTDIGGIARFEKDYYQKHFTDEEFDQIPGNPWYISTLWYAQWIIANAKTKKELKKVEDTFEWCLKYAAPSLIMPEQINPHTGTHISVAPLTWSHSTFVETVLKYIEKWEEL